MNATKSGIRAVLPVKLFTRAKQRLANVVPEQFRRALASVMLRDVLDALAESRLLSGIDVVTIDPVAAEIAEKIGARVLTEDATAGHTGAVNAAVRRLGAEGVPGMIQVPGDIPGITGMEVDEILRGHPPAPSFSIVPAHDGRGSNAVVCSPPDAVPLAFGDDSCVPHIAAARRLGIAPRILKLEGIGMDIDAPEDLLSFARKGWDTRTMRFLHDTGLLALIAEASR